MTYFEWNTKRRSLAALLGIAALLLAFWGVRACLIRTITATDGGSYTITVTYGPRAKLPGGTTLSVQELTGERYEAYYRRAAEELGRMNSLRAFDVRCLAPDGTEVEPASDVRIAFQLDGVENAETLRVLHFPDGADGDPVIPGAAVSRPVIYSALDFRTDSFSVYAVARTVRQQNLTAGDGSAYRITVSYDSDTAGIPEDAELSVEELSADSEAYADYVRLAAEKLGKEVEQLSFAHAFDICLIDPASGEKYQPNSNVKVSIELLGEELGENASVSVVHFEEDAAPEETAEPASGELHTEAENSVTEAESGVAAEPDAPEAEAAEPEESAATPDAVVMDADLVDGAVAFETGSFSVYVVASYTVDFQIRGRTYNLAGGGCVALSELMAALELEYAVYDVRQAVFSSPELLWLEKAAEDTTFGALKAANGLAIEYSAMLSEDAVAVMDESTVEAGDWALISLRSFDTPERLTLDMKDGRVCEIDVTDPVSFNYQGLTYQTVTGTNVKVVGYADDFDDIPTIPATIDCNGTTYTVTDLTFFGSARTLKNKNLFFEQSMLDKMANGAVIDMPDMAAELDDEVEQSLLENGFTPGDKNDSAEQLVWKKAVYNPDTNSVTYELKYFQPVKPNQPLDFIFGIDESGTMCTHDATAAGVKAPRVIWMMAMLQRTAYELVGKNGNGYDNRVAFVPWGHSELQPVAKEDFLSRAEEIDAWFRGPMPYSHAAEGTDHGDACYALREAAELSLSGGRTPIVIYMSDFVSHAGSTASDRNLLKEAPFRTYSFVVFNSGHLDYSRDWSNAGQYESAGPEDFLPVFRDIILDAAGYYMKEQLTVTDQLSEALADITAEAKGADGKAAQNPGTVSASAGEVVWELGGQEPLLGGGQLHTAIFTAKLDDRIAYAGSMPTNGELTVNAGGEVVNTITPAAGRTDELRRGGSLTFLAGRLNAKGGLVTDDNGEPTNKIVGVRFVLTRQGENTPILTEQTDGAGRFTTDANGSFFIDYKDRDGNVVLELGKTYVLTETAESVTAYNNSALEKLVQPDKSWLIQVGSDGIVTVTPEVGAGQTPASSVAKPSRVVLWNKIVVTADLVPIRVRKVWSADDEAHRFPVPFKVYGVGADDTRYELNVYSDNNWKSGQVGWLTADNALPDDPTVWEGTFYVPDKTTENGAEIRFYEEQTLNLNTSHTYYVDGEAKSVNQIRAAYGFRGTVACNQSYRYAIEEGEMQTYEEGWYVPSYINSSDVGAVKAGATIREDTAAVEAKDGWKDYDGPLSRAFQIHINRTDYEYGEIDFNSVTYIGVQIHNSKPGAVISDYYALLKTGDAWYNAGYDTQKTRATRDGVIYWNLPLPREWTGNGLAENTYGTIDYLTVTDFQMFVGDYDDETGYNVVRDGASHIRYGPTYHHHQLGLYVEKLDTGKKYNCAAHDTLRLPDDSIVYTMVPYHQDAVQASTLGTYKINTCTLTINNTWHDNTFNYIAVRKNWVNVPAEQKQPVEFSVTGLYAGGEEPVKAFATHEGWNSENEKHTLTGDMAEDVWTTTCYVPQFNPLTKDANGHPAPERFTDYAVDETELSVIKAEEDAVLDLPGAWQKEIQTKRRQWLEYKDSYEAWVLFETTNTTQNPGGYESNVTDMAFYMQSTSGVLYELRVSGTKIGNADVANLQQRPAKFFARVLLPTGETPDTLSFVNGGVRSSSGNLGTYEYNRQIADGHNPFTAVINPNEPYYGFFTINNSGGHGAPAFREEGLGADDGLPDAKQSYVNLALKTELPAGTETGGLEVRGTPTLRVYADPLFDLTNSYTPYRTVTLTSVFTDTTCDRATTRSIASVVYTVKAEGREDRVFRTEAAPVVTDDGARVDVTATVQVYLPAESCTVEQTAYTLTGEKLDYPTLAYDTEDGITRSLDAETAAAHFANRRKDMPMEVLIDWEPMPAEGEDPLKDNDRSLPYSIIYQIAGGERKELTEGPYERTDSSGAVRAVDEAFRLSEARQTNVHQAVVPTYSVRGEMTRCALNRSIIAKALPEYTVEVLSEEEDGRLVFTIKAVFRRADVRITKEWRDMEPDVLSLSFTLKRSDGAKLYGTDDKVRTLTITRPDVPEEWNGIFEDVPILREDEKSLGVRYILTETDPENDYYTAYEDTTDNEADQLESVVDEQGEKEEYASFCLNDGGIFIRVSNAGRPFICKIVEGFEDSHAGVEHPFHTLNKAMDYVHAHPEVYTAGTATIQMLVNYMLPDTDRVTVAAGDHIKLTTAPKSESFPGEKYFFHGAAGDRAVITRSFNGDSLFENSGTLTLANITLDGGYSTVSGSGLACEKDGGLVSVQGGTLNITEGTTLRNARSNLSGGAVFATGSEGAYGAVNMSGGTIESCYADVENDASGDYAGGGAIFLNYFTNFEMSGNACITKCEVRNAHDATGGAIAKYGYGSFAIHGASDESRVVISDCKAVHGGAVFIKGAPSPKIYGYTTVEKCTAYWCGGAVFNRTDGGMPTELELTDHVVIRDCTAQDMKGGAINTAYGAGLSVSGSVQIANCTAPKGGAINMERQIGGTTKLTVSSGTIESCKATSGNGGAVNIEAFFGAGGGDAELTFSGGTIKGCAASGNGGAIDVEGTGTTKLTLSGGTIESCTASGNGGAIANSAEGGETSAEITVKNSKITGCSARLGSAIYLNNNGTTLTLAGDAAASGGEAACRITGCRASDENGGAINVANAGIQVFFEGSVAVCDNTGRDGRQANMVLSQSSTSVIQTTAKGLSSSAHVGVYVTGGMSPETEPYRSHGGFEDNFGTYDAADTRTEYLGRFINDRNGMIGEVSPKDFLIRWCSYLCKLTDSDGRLLYTTAGDGSYTPAVYKTLTAGFDAANAAGGLCRKDGTAYSAGSAVRVELLRSYTQPENDRPGFSAGRSLTLTTAKTDANELSDGDVYVYNRGSDTTGEDGRAAITRNQTAGSMFTVSSGHELHVTNLILDGANMSSSGEQGGAFNITRASTAEFDTVTFKNCRAGIAGEETGDGGAIHVDAVQTLLVKDCTFADCRSGKDGGAIYANRSDGAIEVTGKSSFTNCEACGGAQTGDKSMKGDGGAIYTCGRLAVTGTQADPITFTDCTAYRDGGAIRTNNMNVAEVELAWCEFSGCKSKQNSGGAMFIGAKTLQADHISVKSCEVPQTGGGIAVQGAEGTISNSVIGESGTGNKSIYWIGGGLYLGNGGKLTLENTEVSGNTAGSFGGGVYIDSGCELTLANAVVSGNTAGSSGGGAYLGGGSTLKLTGETAACRITGCRASGENGGAINVSDGTARVFFEGSVQVYDNTRTDGKRANVVLQADSNDVIQTTEKGLAADARIGVYVPGEPSESASAEDVLTQFDKHGVAGAPFGTFAPADANRENLNKFTSDRNRYYSVGMEEDGFLHWVAVPAYLMIANRSSTAPLWFKVMVDDGTFDENIFKRGSKEQSPISPKEDSDGKHYYRFELGKVGEDGTVSETLFIPNGERYTVEIYKDKNLTQRIENLSYENLKTEEEVSQDFNTESRSFTGSFAPEGPAYRVRIGGTDENPVYQTVPRKTRNYNKDWKDNSYNLAIYDSEGHLFTRDENTKSVIISIKDEGYDVVFRKTGKAGAPLGGAVFTLYEDASCANDKVKKRGEEDITEESLSEEQTVSVNGASVTLPAGTVRMEKVPAGIWYMMEKKTDGAAGTPAGYKENLNKYIVLVGDRALTVPDTRTGEWADVLSGIKQEDIDAQLQDADGDGRADKFAIFQLDSEAESETFGKAVAAPDIRSDGIVNEPAAQHKVILRKVNASHASLENACFRIFRSDLTEVTTGSYEPGKGYQSRRSGVFFVGQLEEGRYYLVETQAPTAVQGVFSAAYHANTGKVFVLTVDTEGGHKPVDVKKTVSTADGMLEELKALAETV